MVQRREGLRLHLSRQRGEDLFVHYSGIEGAGFRSLDEGARVTYEVVQGRKSLQAENVSKVSKA